MTKENNASDNGDTGNENNEKNELTAETIKTMFTGMFDEYSNKQDQKYKSWFGRMEKNIKDVSGRFDSMNYQRDYFDQTNLDDDFDDEPKTASEKLSKLFQKDPMKAFQLVNKINNDAISRAQGLEMSNLENAIDSLNGQPFMEDIGENVKEMAKNLVKAGYSGKDAVELAFEKCKSSHFEGMFSKLNESNPGALETLKGGNPPKPPEKGKKLPPEFEKACEKGIADGIFKDKEDYINNLSPRIKEQYGIA